MLKLVHTGVITSKVIHYAIKISVNLITINFSYYVYLITMIYHWLSMSLTSTFHLSYSFTRKLSFVFLISLSAVVVLAGIFFSLVFYKFFFLYFFSIFFNYQLQIRKFWCFFFNKHWQKSPQIDMTFELSIWKLFNIHIEM